MNFNGYIRILIKGKWIIIQVADTNDCYRFQALNVQCEVLPFRELDAEQIEFLEAIMNEK